MIVKTTRTLLALAAVLGLVMLPATALAQGSYSPVTDQRLVKPEPENWLQIRGNYQGWGYSPLGQITPGNVKKLTPVWARARAVSPGDRQARRASQHVHSGARALAQGPRAQVQPQDRSVRASDVHGGRRAHRLEGALRGVPQDRAPPGPGLRSREGHRAGAGLDRGEEGGQPPQAVSRALVIAHRGASGYEVENSLAAFRAAARLGADGIELDVHATADDTPVVHHDETLGGTHPLPHPSAPQLQGFRPAHGRPLPTLAQALDVAGRSLQVFVEGKSLAPQVDGRLLEALDRGPNPG